MRKSRIITFAVAVALTAQAAFATNISGVSGNNGTFNINPEVANGDTGFRQYENFYLSKGDIANLIFKYGNRDVSKFVNLVDGKVNIQGIVNTMRDGNFYNGHAIFISPNGMVVGESGVLNVGSLSVLTPSNSTYDKLKANPTAMKLKDVQNETNADILIRGKVLARDNVNLQGAHVILPEGSTILNGVQDNVVIKTQEQANEILFKNLVNTLDMNTGETEIRDGKIVIKSDAKEGGINIRGDVYNMNKGSIKVVNNQGTDGIKVTGGVYNKNGDLALVNNAGKTLVKGTLLNQNGTLLVSDNGEGIHLNSGSLISSDGVLSITNKGTNGLSMYGDVVANGNAAIVNHKGNMYVAGKVDLKGNSTANIVNAAKDNSKFQIASSGSIKSDNKIYMENKADGGMFINGEVTAAKNLNMVNKAGDFTVNNKIAVTEGNLTVNNAGNKLAVASKGSIGTTNGNLVVKNSGANGMIIDGTVSKSGDGVTSIYNTNGEMRINGKVDVKDSNLGIVNKGSGLVIGKNAQISNYGTKEGTESSTNIINTGEDGLMMYGKIATDKTLNIYNDNGKMVINGDINNEGADTNIYGRRESTGIYVTKNSHITNNIISTDADGKVVVKPAYTGDVIIRNVTGNDGLIIDGQVAGYKNVNITNNKGNTILSGSVEAKDTAKFVSTSTDGEVNLNKGAKVEAADIKYGLIRGSHVNNKGAQIIKRNLSSL
ncbi:TPA: leukotoxin LktA family filamentous adhesin [Candidatus Gastranaerophilales bacterium HUM_20]|mgnify:FL=1|nr:putative leukotoxin LktA like protein [Clostridium sp. CAG:729]DAB21991.1 MAG TPA: leukotoxin LktA family filamentous adhesin [Candidatus Gastranaerophilales bacterium HUM_20]